MLREIIKEIKDKRNFTLMIFTPSAQSSYQRLNIAHQYIYAILAFAVIGIFTVIFSGVSLVHSATITVQYKLAQMENRKLREQNDVVQQNQHLLQGRLAAMEPIQRKLAEASGLNTSADVAANVGSGGPETKDAKDLEKAASDFEAELRQIKEVMDSRQIKLSAIPSSWPVRGYISDGFGSRTNPFGGGGGENHPGLDIATTFGTAIEATGDGIVIFSGAYGGYGNLVVIDHGYGITTRYGHMSRIDVTAGQHVHRGMQIGAVGSTGRSTGPHCHYEVRLHDRAVNPINYLPVAKS